ncbi:RNA polymerase subunit sigma-24 [Streptomyces sp. NPDC050564]|uniref:RNA polymerase subunit sigma-24 n=1 Tax=Streptomyces sp. NPDC050564 TaxID=3365631 RepID=UPI00379303C7
MTGDIALRRPEVLQACVERPRRPPASATHQRDAWAATTGIQRSDPWSTRRVAQRAISLTPERLGYPGSARVRRERCVSEWIPEPLPDRTEWISGPAGGGGFEPVDPADRVTLDESVNMTFLVVLESMTPAERVAFILHGVFRYPFAEVARIVGQAGLVRHFKEAWEARDIEALVDLLDPDATVIADGGGLVGTVLRPVGGSEHIAQYLIHIADKAPGLTLLERTINGQPGLVAQHAGVTVTVAAFSLTGGRITRI